MNNNIFNEENFPRLGETEIIKKPRFEGKRHAEFRPSLYGTDLPRDHSSSRMNAYGLMKDQKSLAEQLVKTRPCKFVTRITDQDGSLGPHGVCTRNTCTFAHSLDELRLPICAFGRSCNKFHGVLDTNGKLNTTIKCQFYHPEIETPDAFYVRTGQEKPDLPLNSKLSHQPKSPESIERILSILKKK